MKVLYSNPPWWLGQEDVVIDVGTAVTGKILKTLGINTAKVIKLGVKKKPLFSKNVKRLRQGVRAGSRWPFTYVGRSCPDDFIPGDYIPYPFFMGYAASYLAKHTTCNVTLRDSIALKESYDRYYEYINKERFDFIFIESSSPSWEHDKNVILKINQLSHNSKVVVTGPISSMGEKILNDLPVYAVIMGEYEKNSLKVLEGTSGVLDYNFLTEDEMNDAPFPYFDKAVIDRYWDSNPIGQKWPHAQIWSSRGCLFKCIFCVWPATMTGNDPEGNAPRRVRYYSPEYIKQYLNFLIKQYEFKSIYFDDDTFNFGDKHAIAIANVMQEAGLPWSAMCRPDTIKLDTWSIMKKSGCFGVKLGFESGNQYVVDKIVNKKLNLENAAKVVKHLQSIGIKVHGTFTFGLPGETKDQMQDTVSFIKRLNFDTVQFSGCAEIDGTPLSSISKKKKKLESYEGAIIECYDHKVDGGKKWQDIEKQLFTLD